LQEKKAGEPASLDRSAELLTITVSVPVRPFVPITSAITITVLIGPTTVIAIMVTIAPSSRPAIPVAVSVPIPPFFPAIFPSVPTPFGAHEASRIFTDFFAYTRMPRQKFAEFRVLGQVSGIVGQPWIASQVLLNRGMRIQKAVEIPQFRAVDVVIVPVSLSPGN